MPMKPDEKARNLLGILYSEDFEEKGGYGALLQYLDGLQVPCACSCVHDRDTFTQGDIQKFIASHTDRDTGQVDYESIKNGVPTLGQHKKPHVHVLLRYPGPVFAQTATDAFEDFVHIAPNRWEKCVSPSASLRYFAHLDTPEKAQYGALSVKGFGGIDMSDLLKTSKTTNIEVLLDVMEHILTNDVHHYNKLVRWAMSTADIDTISCVVGRASFFANYFRAESDERAEKAAKKKRQEESKAVQLPETAVDY